MTNELIRGDLSSGDAIDWEPLLRLAGGDLTVVANFMWMFEIQLDDDVSLQAYKHWRTRRYLHLGPRAEAFLFVAPKRYEQVCGQCLLALALMIPGPDIRQERALLRRMMYRCGWGVHTDD